MLLVLEIPPWLPPLWLVPAKKQKTNWHFAGSRSPGNKFQRHFESKYDEYYIFISM